MTHEFAEEIGVGWVDALDGLDEAVETTHGLYAACVCGPIYSSYSGGRALTSDAAFAPLAGEAAAT